MKLRIVYPRAVAWCNRTRTGMLALAARPYESLEPDELDELMAILEPLATLLVAAQD